MMEGEIFDDEQVARSSSIVSSPMRKSVRPSSGTNSSSRSCHVGPRVCCRDE